MCELRVVDLDDFETPESKAVRRSGRFGVAIEVLEDACRSDSAGKAVILTLDDYDALIARAE